MSLQPAARSSPPVGMGLKGRPQAGGEGRDHAPCSTLGLQASCRSTWDGCEVGERGVFVGVGACTSLEVRHSTPNPRELRCRDVRCGSGHARRGREGGRLLLAYVVLCASVPLMYRLFPWIIQPPRDRRGSIEGVFVSGAFYCKCWRDISSPPFDVVTGSMTFRTPEKRGRVIFFRILAVGSWSRLLLHQAQTPSPPKPPREPSIRPPPAPGVSHVTHHDGAPTTSHPHPKGTRHP